MRKKLKKFDKFAGLSNIEIIQKKLRDKTYLLLRRFINYRYHKKLSSFKELKNLIDELSKANKMSADISDCIALYEDILNYQPNYILELGPGTSTSAICLAISKIKEAKPNYKPTFIAIESREEWMEYHLENIPKELLKNVELITRKEDTKVFKNEKVAYYKDIPLHPYNYIHVDGPDIHGLGVDLQSDLIALEKYLNNDCIIVFDGRRNAARFSRKHMHGFKFRRHSKTLNHIISKKNIRNGFLLDFLIRN
tara:strand:- start:731 stop:1486 length:756 start_codon:yes stop_codon:yes gene_type:complete